MLFFGAWGGNRTLNPLRAWDFKSHAYASSATQAIWRRRPELNRCKGFCRPVPNHSATTPY